MTTVYFLCGIGRSGTHAIGSWLLPQIRPFLQMDDMSQEYSFSYGHYKKIKEQVASGQLEMQSYDWNTVEQLDSRNYESNRNWIPFTDQHNLLIHVESIELKHTGKEIEEYQKAGVDFKTILLLRNPFNNLASERQANASLSESRVDLWKQIAREFLGYTNYLGDKVLCIYDLWFTSEKYRKSMSKKLGVEWDDSGLNTITRHGQSHFERKEVAQDLKVLERWKHYYSYSDEVATWYHLKEETIDASSRNEFLKEMGVTDGQLRRFEELDDPPREIVATPSDEMGNYKFRQLFDEELVELWKIIIAEHKECDIKNCLENGLEILKNELVIIGE